MIDYSPIGHPDSSKLYRVPVQILDGVHTVYVGDKHKRIFDVNTLPDFIKHKLSMIIVTNDGGQRWSLNALYDTPSNEFRIIGWRASDSMFCLVMTDEELYLLRGKNDT